MDHSGLGGVIRSLELGDVDDMAAHRRGGDETAAVEILQLFPVDVGAFLLLSPPDGCTGAGDVERAVDIGRDHLAVVVELAVGHGALGPRDAGVCDDDVEPAIEFLDDLVDGRDALLRVLDVDLVCSACKRKHPGRKTSQPLSVMTSSRWEDSHWTPYFC